MDIARRLLLVVPVALALGGCGRVVPAPVSVPPSVTPAPSATPIPAAAPTVMPSPADTPRPPEPVTLVIWHALGDPAGINALNDHARRAVAGLPGFKVSAVAVASGDILDQYRNAVAGGGGPDLLLAPDATLADDARAGLIMDITDLAGDAPAKWDAAARARVSVDGRVYGVPLPGGDVLYVNPSGGRREAALALALAAR